MNEKIILTDCDGVLLDWLSGFHSYMADLGYEKKVDGIYSISETYGIEYKKSKEFVCSFNKSDAMATLPAIREAEKYLPMLAELGYKFKVITSQTDDARGKILRTFNLLQEFGLIFDEVEILGCGDDKDEALEPYRDSGMFWVEDKPENADVGSKLGLRSLLMVHDHNEDYVHEDVEFVYSWKDVYDKVAEQEIMG